MPDRKPPSLRKMFENTGYYAQIERLAQDLHPTSGDTFRTSLILSCPHERFLEILSEFIVHYYAALRNFERYEPKYKEVSHYVESHQMARTMVQDPYLLRYLKEEIAKYRAVTTSRRTKRELIEKSEEFLKRLVAFLRKFTKVSSVGRPYQRYKDAELLNEVKLIPMAFSIYHNAKDLPEDTWELFVELFDGYHDYLIEQIVPRES